MNEVTPRAFVFDAYGTLFDVHAAIARHRAAAGADADRFSELWRTKQLEYSWTLTLAGRYVDFWTLTERALDYAFARFPSVDRALRPEASRRLSQARRISRRAHHGGTSQGARTCKRAILSNGSPAMLDAAVAASGMAGLFDAVLSVDTVRAYKPRPEVYALVTARFAIKPNDVASSSRRTAGTSWARPRSASARSGSIARKCRTNMPNSRRCASSPISRRWRRLST